MRLRIFFASAALLLIVSARALACGPYWYYPEDYYMFRVYDKEAVRSFNPDADDNCAAWKALTGGCATQEDIRQVVYKYSLDQLSRIMNERRSENSFARYIASRKDTEIADFLVVAKTCELARFEKNDPWYYPCKDDPTMASLENVIDKSLSYSGKRLEDRYVLQAVRAMFTLGRYSQIDSLWKAREEHLREGVIKHMTRGYVAGAAYNLGDKEKAMKYYMENDDLESLYAYYSQFGSYSSILDYAAQHCPDSPSVPSMLQDVVSLIERNSDSDYYEKENETKARELLKICDKAVMSAKEPGMWYYTAAFLSDLTGDTSRALSYVTKAEGSRKSKFISESVKVLRMYLDAKTCTFDDAYKSRLFSQIRWLDGKVASCITPNVKAVTAEGYRLHLGMSYYYWNDMLRKVLIGYVAPRMDKVDPVLSLRLRNMADNRLLNIVDRFSTDWYEGKWHSESRVYTMKEYRSLKEESNMFDYSNYFFEALDSLDLKAVVAYEAGMGLGETEMDRYLDARGFIDHNYVLDVIGTRYIRERNYKEAVKYLSRASSSYETRLNVYRYFRREPFSYAEKKAKMHIGSYKLSFAKEMSALEKRMKSSDPDVRGEAMVRYGMGLRSSFNYCWPLTQYHLNLGDEWMESDYVKKANADAGRYIDDGCRTIKDAEKAAQAYVALCRFRTAVERYPETRTAAMVVSQCDKLVDHKYLEGRVLYNKRTQSDYK